MLVAGITSSITSFVGNHSVVAVFALLVLAAVFPAASELVMLYAGAVAAGAFADAHVVLFGSTIRSHAGAYVVIVIAGILGNVIGAGIGWFVGDLGGRPLIERHGGKLHVTPAKLDRAERWLAGHGALAVVVGFAAPILRSFVAIPAGIVRVPFGRFIVAALIGCAIFCFTFAGIGWAVGSSYSSVRRYVDYIAIAAIVLLAVYVWFRWRSTKLARGRASDSSR